MILTLIILYQLSFVLNNINGQVEYKERGQRLTAHVAFGCVGAYYDAVSYRINRTFKHPEVCGSKHSEDISIATDGHFYGFKLGKDAEEFKASLHINSRDENGDKKSNGTGTIKDGVCKGDKFDMFNYFKVTKGSCNSANGVTALDTYPDGMATLKITGNCKTTCVGRGRAMYHHPGKKNPKLARPIK